MLSNQSMEIPSGSNHSTTSSSNGSGSSSSKSAVLLPQNFVPHQYTIICGRGKVCTTSKGNQRLSKIIDVYRNVYAQATNKNEKTEIVSMIMDQVKANGVGSNYSYGLFVKIEGGRYYQVKEAIVREKVGGILRDRLHTQYRSSSKAKVAKRKAIKEMNQQSLMSTMNMNLNAILGTPAATSSSMMTNMPSGSSTRINVIEALDDACNLIAGPSQSQSSSMPLPKMSPGFFKSMKPTSRNTPRQVSIDDVDDTASSISSCSSTLSDNLFASSGFDDTFMNMIPDDNTIFSASSFDW